ncbi:MAG: GH92 family glycosyl hydrolase [Bacteroidales bacterium]|nr:GH92 family glycosyl hydrolase [Bacteroidales bacterium]
MKKYLIPILFLLASCSARQEEFYYPDEDLLEYVDVKTGSGGHGHVFVGASVPFGAIQLGPTSIPQGWDWCSGYHDSDSTIIGFSHTHLSGTGIGDLFDVTVMPVVGKVSYARGSEDEPASGLWSYGERSKEECWPGYYSIPLERYGILAEMTATKRVGMHRYTFPATKTGAIVLDLENGGCWDAPTSTSITQVVGPDGKVSALEGYRFSTGWAKNQKVFFHAEFSEPIKSVRLIEKAYDSKDPSSPEDVMYARVEFGELFEGQEIMVKVALSPVSVENARLNMEEELPLWDFDATAAAAMIAWDSQLEKVRIDSEQDKSVFYTALYHTMIAPSLFCDVNGDYRGADGEVYNSKSNIYTTYSLWDTYRAQMPLLSILQPELMPDMIGTMLDIYDKQGKLPVWHLMGWETHTMVGNPGVISVGDAIVKGLQGFDREAAFEAMKASVMLTDRGQGLRQEHGYIPSDLCNWAVAQDMEYAIADGAVANAAAVLGRKDDEQFFRERSHSYRNYMDSTTLFARGRLSDGSWRTPFNPFESDAFEQDYVEGNAWQYTWLAPQDFDGLVQFYGSRERLVERLDSLFAADTRLDNAPPDITGLIGQYVHGNEPSHHIIYFYTMAGRRDKAAEKVRQVLSTLYSKGPDGLSGNEDVGQMSAWYILSALGFYQVEPASQRFWFGSPLFGRTSIAVPGGHFEIIAHDNSPEHIYIDKVKLNGKILERDYILYSEIMKGGTLEFFMK